MTETEVMALDGGVGPGDEGDGPGHPRANRTRTSAKRLLDLRCAWLLMRHSPDGKEERVVRSTRCRDGIGELELKAG